MIVRQNKHYETNLLYPNTDWYNQGNYVVEDGSPLAQKIISLYPNYSFVLDSSGKLTDVTAIDPPLSVAQQDKINELDAKCDAAIIAGFTSSALGTAHTYPSDKEAQDYLKDCIKRLELDSTKTTVGFKTLDAGYLDHTLAQLHQVFIDGFDYGDNQIIKLNNLKAQVNAATTVSTVNAIVWS